MNYGRLLQGMATEDGRRDAGDGVRVHCGMVEKFEHNRRSFLSSAIYEHDKVMLTGWLPDVGDIRR